MNASVQRFGHLRIDRCTKTGQTTEGGLDVAAGAAEPIVEIEMAESGIEVVEPHQAYDTATEPDAFWISSRSVDGLRSFREFIGLALTVLRGIGRRRLLRLVLSPRISTLGDSASKPDQKGKA
jgi:hypothetical protein